MKKRTTLLLALCVSTGAPAQSQEEPPPVTPSVDKPDVKPVEAIRDPKAIEILKRANVATPKVKSFTYTAKFSVEGFNPLRLRLPHGIRMTGSFTAAANEDQGTPKLRYDVKYTSADAKEAQEFSFGENGDLFFFIDPKTKTVYEDIDSIILGPRAKIGALGLRMREYLHPNPFNDEIGGRKVELGDDRIIGDVPCYEVHVQYAQASQEAYWYFGKKDYLPRGVRRVFTNGQGEESTVTMMITNLAVNPSFFVDPFTALLPEGWTKNTDDVAP